MSGRGNYRGGGRDGGGRGGRDGGRGGRGGRDGGRGGRGDGGGGRGRDGGGRYVPLTPLGQSLVAIFSCVSNSRLDRGDSFGRGGGGGGRGRGPSVPRNIDSVVANVLKAKVTDNFSFWRYNLDSRDARDENIEARGRRDLLFRRGFWDLLLANRTPEAKEDLKRVLFYAGSVFYCARQVPELAAVHRGEHVLLPGGTDGDVMTVVGVARLTPPAVLRAAPPPVGAHQVAADLRCSQCTLAFTSREGLEQHCSSTGHMPVLAMEGLNLQETTEATVEEFSTYINFALKRALLERFDMWGSEFIDPKAQPVEAADRQGNPLGIKVHEAFSCSFTINKDLQGKAYLALTVDLRAKIIRTTTVLDALYNGKYTKGQTLSPAMQRNAMREWEGERVVYILEKKSRYQCRHSFLFYLGLPQLTIASSSCSVYHYRFTL
jgi:hypothetical protein